MARKFLTSALLISGGAIAGFIAGAILGGLIGRGVYFAIERRDYEWMSLFCGISGAEAGFISGAGTGGLGIRSRLGFEWPLIFGIGIPLGMWIQSGAANLDLDAYLVSGIGAIACWLVVHLLRLIFGKWLIRGSLRMSVAIVYVFIFALVVFVALPVMQLMNTIFYF